jgi:hypothetical protein
MRKAILASGLMSIILSSAAQGAEIHPAERKVECGKWIDDVQTCEHYYNGQKTSGITRKHRNRRFRIEVVEYAWDGKTFDEAAQYSYDDLGRVTHIQHYISKEMDWHYYCLFEDGKKTSEYIDNRQGQQLYEAKDLNEDGKIDYNIRSYYDEKGKLIEKILDDHDDGDIDAAWDFQTEEWISLPPKPVKKVYKPQYYIW